MGRFTLIVSIVAIQWSSCSRDPVGGVREKASSRPSPLVTSKPSSVPAQTSLARLLENAAPDGWVRVGAVEQYTPQSLYEKIDGLADLFLSYDVVGLSVANYKKSPESQVLLEAYIYDMGTPTNAFGVFSVERSPNEPRVDIGREAYHSDASVFIWTGQYYLKIIASDATDELAKVGLALAGGLARSLSDSGRHVWGLKALPQANLVPRSQRYFRVDAMGLDFMRDTYTAQYRRGEAVVDAFLSRQDTPEAAGATIERYVAHARKYGRAAETLVAGGMKLIRCDMGRTFDVIFAKGRLVAGVTAVGDSGLAVQAAIDLGRELDESADTP